MLYCSTCKKEVEIKTKEVTHSNGKTHIEARCAVCDRWIKYLPQEKPIEEVIIPFGKYKGEKIVNLPSDYLWWLLENNAIKGNLKKQIQSLFEPKI